MVSMAPTTSRRTTGWLAMEKSSGPPFILIKKKTFFVSLSCLSTTRDEPYFCQSNESDIRVIASLRFVKCLLPRYFRLVKDLPRVSNVTEEVLRKREK